MKYKLFISDFDWTLGNVPDFIEPQTVEAIKKYEEKGGKFCIVTGRSFCSIRDICKKYGIGEIVASCQGSKISNVKTDEVYFEGGLDYSVASSVVKDLLKSNVQTIVWCDETLLYTTENYYVDLYRTAEKVTVKKVDDLMAEVVRQGKPVSKICVVCQEEETDKLVKIYKEKYDGLCLVNSGSKRLVEFINPKCNKGFAINYIANMLNVPTEEIIAVGDSSNDLDLVSGEWWGVAVGDGDENIKSLANEVTVPYKEKPVKVLLEKYCL